MNMLTAPTLAQEAPPAEAETTIDYEAEASRMGWKPIEDFKGDPTRHVDAKTFYERGQEMMPILQAQNKALLKRLDAMEREQKRSAEFFSKAESRAYDRAREDIKREMAAAVESGDQKAADAALDKLDKLEKPKASGASTNDDPDARAEEFADWGKANKWYATNTVMQAYADAQAAKIAREKGGGFLDRADLDEVTERVKAKFTDEFPEEQAAKPRARAATEGVSQPRGRAGGKSYNDLPPEARAMCDKWVKNGVIKSREDYVKSFDFEGYRA